MFWRLALATCWWLTLVAKDVCSAFRRQFLKLFQFSLEFLWLFTVFPISLSTETDPNPPQTPFLHHFFSNLQEKVWVFFVSLHFPCFESAFLCLYECIGVIMFLKNVLLVQGFVLSWWLFIVWELVFLTLLLVFIWCLGSVHCFMIVVVSFISCLWYSITLFVIWILIMLSAHLISSY